MRQALITNYMNNWDGVVRTLEQHAPRAWVTNNLQLVYDDEGPDITAYLPYDGGREVARLELYVDNQDEYWINKIDVPSVHHRRYGIATSMYRHAVQTLGPIYASSLEVSTGWNDDTRELKDEGKYLVQSLKRRGYMREGWHRYPIA